MRLISYFVEIGLVSSSFQSFGQNLIKPTLLIIDLWYQYYGWILIEIHRATQPKTCKLVEVPPELPPREMSHASTTGNPWSSLKRIIKTQVKPNDLVQITDLKMVFSVFRPKMVLVFVLTCIKFWCHVFSCSMDYEEKVYFRSQILERPSIAWKCDIYVL